jgi:DNA-binding transcriptional ArsR family regulator
MDGLIGKSQSVSGDLIEKHQSVSDDRRMAPAAHAEEQPDRADRADRAGQSDRPEQAEQAEPTAAERDADARALASTLRIRILRLCLDEALTNREIAERLGKNPATVLHHVRTLADRGFLAAEPVRRGARGSREVPYRATRKSWRTPGGAGRTRVLVDAFLEEFALVPDPDDVQMARLGLRLDEAGYADLSRRMQVLLEEFASRPADPDGTPYSLFYVLHEDVTRRPGSERAQTDEPGSADEPG